MRCGAVRCTITYGAVWLCHFAGDFGVVFAVLCTPLALTIKVEVLGLSNLVLLVNM